MIENMSKHRLLYIYHCGQMQKKCELSTVSLVV